MLYVRCKYYNKDIPEGEVLICGVTGMYHDSEYTNHVGEVIPCLIIETTDKDHELLIPMDEERARRYMKHFGTSPVMDIDAFGLYVTTDLNEDSYHEDMEFLTLSATQQANQWLGTSVKVSSKSAGNILDEIKV